MHQKSAFKKIRNIRVQNRPSVKKLIIWFTEDCKLKDVLIIIHNLWSQSQSEKRLWIVKYLFIADNNTKNNTDTDWFSVTVKL